MHFLAEVGKVQQEDLAAWKKANALRCFVQMLLEEKGEWSSMDTYVDLMFKQVELFLEEHGLETRPAKKRRLRDHYLAA